MLKNGELLNVIVNPKDNDLILSCMIYIDESNVGKKTEIVKIKRNANSFELVFEKDIITTYTRDRKNTMVASNFEKVNCCTDISFEEIQCILSFISSNPEALSIFRDYLKENSKKNKPAIIKNNDEIKFEEINEVVHGKTKEIKAISFSAQEKKGVYEKYISINQNGTWRNVYYGAFDRNGIIMEMIQGLTFEQIELIRDSLKENEKMLDHFDKCIKVESIQNQLIKKY